MTAESTLFRNGIILTAGSIEPRPASMIVEDALITHIGSESDLTSHSGVRTVDLDGGFVVPGFNDCHMHVLSMGLNLGQIDVTPTAAPSIEAIQSRIRERVSSGAAAWLRGRGYNQNLLREQRHPNRHDLDIASPGRPVALWHTSGHVATTNSRALELAGVTAETDDPAGGEIERFADGSPTGVLKETAMELVRRVIPLPTMPEARDAILAASRVLASEGITSASDAATGQNAPLTDELESYRAALASGRLATRLVVMPMIQALLKGEDIAAPASLDAGDNPEWLKVGSAKIFSDGALTTRTAAVIHPYADTGSNGILTWDTERLKSLIAIAHGAGWQIATHAIGDRAIDAVINAYASAMDILPRPDARHRIEHCTLASRDQVQRMRGLGILAVLQPEDIAVLGDAYFPALGDTRASDNSPVAWFLTENIHTAFSSDRPVTPGNPLAGIRAAVERITPTGRVQGAEHRVSVKLAIGLYTEGSAHATLASAYTGKLAPGLRADFAVLDRDITRCPPEEISRARVLRTVVDGRTVFEA